jgi:hypothetical protein
MIFRYYYYTRGTELIPIGAIGLRITYPQSYQFQPAILIAAKASGCRIQFMSCPHPAQSQPLGENEMGHV